MAPLLYQSLADLEVKADLFVVIDSGLGLKSGFKSILLELDLNSDLGRFVTKFHFQFSLCTFCSVLLRPYEILPTRIVHTTKDLLTFLISAAELTHAYSHLHCADLFCWYILQLRTWTWTRSHVVLAVFDLHLKLVDLNLTSTWTWLLLDLIQV